MHFVTSMARYRMTQGRLHNQDSKYFIHDRHRVEESGALNDDKDPSRHITDA